MLRRLVVLLLLLLVAAPARAGEPSWFRLQVGTHPLSIEVPSLAGREHETSDWFLGRAVTDTLKGKAGELSLQASVTVAPETALQFAGSGLVFSTTRDTILRQARGRAVSWSDVRRFGLQGKRLTYEVAGDGAPLTGVMEVYVTGPYILTLDVRGPRGTPADLVERFLASARWTR